MCARMLEILSCLLFFFFRFKTISTFAYIYAHASPLSLSLSLSVCVCVCVCMTEYVAACVHEYAQMCEPISVFTCACGVYLQLYDPSYKIRQACCTWSLQNFYRLEFIPVRATRMRINQVEPSRSASCIKIAACITKNAHVTSE